MKSILTIFISISFMIQISIADIYNDTLEMGAGYSNDIWYSLENGVVKTQPKDNWNIAVSLSGFGSSVRINDANTSLWLYPNGDTDDWENVDSTGLSDWTQYYNSTNSWEYGAFEYGLESGNPFDLGWGVYNQVTHIVSGDSLFILKIGDEDYRKIMIETLKSGTFTIKYSNLDNSNEKSVEINKKDYKNKNFIYYSIENDEIIDREPTNTDWDLLFTQYIDFLPVPYLVSGVLSNSGVQVAEAKDVSRDYNDYYNEDFSEDRNVIGYDWKSFQGQWTLDDSRVYFVADISGEVWKLFFTEFEGSSTGKIIFTKERLSPSSVEYERYNSVSLYPNPVNTSNITIDFKDSAIREISGISIVDQSGRTVKALNNIASSQSNLNLPVDGLNNGSYFLRIETLNKIIIKKFIIQK